MITVAKAYPYKLTAKALEEGLKHGVHGSALHSIEYVEKNPIPADAYYFPLSYDAKGYMPGAAERTINPVHASNLRFDNDGCWVGKPVSNLWPTLSGNYGWIGGTVSTAPLGGYVDNTQITLTKPGGTTVNHTTLELGNTLSIAAGNSYTLSCYYRDLTNAAALTEFRLAKSNSGATIAATGIQNSIPSPKLQIQRGWSSALYQETVTAWPYLRWYGVDAMSIKLGALMLEAKPFVSAYTRNPQATSGLLTWNLHSTIDLNWNEDYTIIYWKKIHGTSTDNVTTGFNIDSIGRNSNTVGGGYRLWGKIDTGNIWRSLSSSYQTAYNTEDLQYQWAMVVLRRSGTSLTNRVYVGPGLLAQGTVDDSTATANRYVTQDGRDLQLGGWDNNLSNAVNSYYKDLYVVKRALSDDQLDAIYNTKLKVYENSIHSSYIEEGLI